MDPLLIGSAFVAGLLMFLAPCTLPILPGYLGFISGLTHAEMADPTPGNGVRRRLFKHAFAFVLGFTGVFVSFGLLAGYAGSLLTPVRSTLTIVGGAIIFLFGLFLIGVFRIPILVKERRITLPAVLRKGTPVASFLLGASFAFGWTPCIGPILGTVLFFAGNSETVTAGALLLLVFSIGYALPFMLLALAVERVGEYITRITPFLRALSFVGGVVLLIIGLRLMCGGSVLTDWFYNLLTHFNIEDRLYPYL